MIFFLTIFILLSCTLSQDIPIIRIGILKIDKEINLTRVGEIINSHTKVEVEGNGSFTLKIERENAILNFGKDIL
ncbi:MAG: hypothetical protein N2312_07005, partial [Dictyoglomaceae bacterium]|nr:hypothetical protein [Dictyoglomaceae bacterium]